MMDDSWLAPARRLQVGLGLNGRVSQQALQEEQIIPADAEQLGQGWVKLTPKDPLQPGEYAIAELLGKEGMNSFVWDFGMHPDAPANMSVIKPEASTPKKTPEVPDETEKLQKRDQHD